ncbi:MAG: hypothetical protein ACR2N9_05900, partial [Acidimicrobiia bacterium]
MMHYARWRRRGDAGPGDSLYGDRGQICACGQAAVARGRCAQHYQSWRRDEGILGACSVKACNRSAFAKGLC